MALHPHQIIVPQVVSTLRTLGEFPVAVDGILETIWFKTDDAAAGEVQIQFELNGVLFHTMTVGAGLGVKEDAALTYEVSVRDTITIKSSALPAFNSFGPRSYFQLDVNDGFPTVGPEGPAGPEGPEGPQGPSGVVESVVAGTNISVDNTDPANPIISSTGGGGGSSGIYSPDVPYSSPSAFDDEFTAGALDGKWTVHNSLPYSLVLSNFFKPASTSTQLKAIYQAISPTGNVSWVMKVLFSPVKGGGVTNFLGFYFRALAASGVTRRTFGIRYSATVLGAQIVNWLDNDTEHTSTNITSQVANGSPLYLRLDYVHGSLNMFFSISYDGLTWCQLNDTTTLGGAFPLTAAPTEVGIANWNNVPATDVMVDWFRELQGGYVGGTL